MAYLHAHSLTLTGIILTHHHSDHVGGVARLLQYKTVPVYGPADIPVVSHPVHDEETFTLPGIPAEIKVMAVPGHTLNHLAYYTENALFCGDTLFACGCGRIFEGTPEIMYHSLQRLASLPDGTEVYCAHEYTLANEAFAIHVDPDNPALATRMQHDQALRQQGQPTLPSSIALEKATNPFLRAPDVKSFAALRQAKDHF